MENHAARYTQICNKIRSRSILLSFLSVRYNNFLGIMQIVCTTPKHRTNKSIKSHTRAGDTRMHESSEWSMLLSSPLLSSLLQHCCCNTLRSIESIASCKTIRTKTHTHLTYSRWSLLINHLKLTSTQSLVFQHDCCVCLRCAMKISHSIDCNWNVVN